MSVLSRVRLGVLVLATLILPVTQAGAQEATPQGSAAHGSFDGLVDIGGRSVYLSCRGEGSPTVVIDHGQYNSSQDMTLLAVQLAADSHVCVYDRAGQGRSDPPPASNDGPRTAADVVGDLHALLEAAEVPGPYLLYGHSASGMFVQLYARTYPEDVAAVVSENAVPPSHPWLDDALPLMTEQERAEELAYYAGGPGNENFDWTTSFEQLAATGPAPDVPMLVLISTIAQCDSPDDVCGRTYGVYETVMQGVAADWPQGAFLELAGSHDLYLAPEAVEVIRLAIAAARAPETWTTAFGTPIAATPQPG